MKHSAYSYEEFDIDSAISPTTNRVSVVLAGASNIKKIYASSSKSTEEFIGGAVSNIGSANRNIMYVNSTLNGLQDRLEIASRIAKNVNTAKSRGMEGFSNVKPMDPWEYAVEGSVGEFFKKIWRAIRTACHNVLTAIANFIKWIANVIASAGVKSQVKDYEHYKANKAKIASLARAGKADTIKFNSLKWSVNSTQLAKMISSASAHYIGMFNESQDTKLIDKMTSFNPRAMESSADFAREFGKIFGGAATVTGGVHLGGGQVGSGAKHDFARAKGSVTRMIDAINSDMEQGVAKVLGAKTSGKVSPHELVLAATTTGGKVQQVPVAFIQKQSGDFEVLSSDWLAKNVKSNIAATSSAQKQFAIYTKKIDAIAGNFDKVVKGSPGVSSLSKLTADLANARIRYNNYYTSLMLELQSTALRFRKSAHIALKQYLKYETGAPKKSAEAYVQNVDDLFASL